MATMDARLHGSRKHGRRPLVGPLALPHGWAAREYAPDGDPPGGGEPGGGGGDPPGGGGDETAKLRAEIVKLRDEAAKNRIAAKGKAEIEAQLTTALAALDAHKAAQMTEAEKALAEAEKAKTRAAALEKILAEKDEAIAHQARVRRAIAAGVADEDIQDLVARKLADAEKAGGEGFDAVKWLEGYLADRPTYLGAAHIPTPTAGGHPRPSGDPEIRELNTRIDVLEKQTYRTRDEEGELLGLRMRKQRAEARAAAK